MGGGWLRGHNGAWLGLRAELALGRQASSQLCCVRMQTCSHVVSGLWRPVWSGTGATGLSSGALELAWHPQR